MFALALALLPDAAASDKPPYDKHVSITFSPLHIFSRTGEVTAEGRIVDKLGLAGILGVGAPAGYALLEVGTSARYYVVGSFDHGMQLGAEILYAHLSTEQGGIDASGDTAAIGPFVGYKIAARFGLTFEGQLGAQYQISSARAQSGAQSASASDSRIIPLLNLNLGWSF
ncbi:MAG: hypothetical protein Q8P18_07305 [Pseudomonadota bacterium]|nr:hypothetical protein [Pseudomonadota bacterium]